MGKISLVRNKQCTIAELPNKQGSETASPEWTRVRDAADSGHQGAVDAYFQGRIDHWREVYEREDLDGLIYRGRHLAVLAMVSKLELPPGSHVLEVGCGAGLTTVTLARRGYIVTAADTVDEMLDLTRQTAIAAGVETAVRTCRTNAQSLSFDPNLFDLAVAIGVIPWVEDPEVALTEIARVLKPGGYAVVTNDNQWCLTHILDPRCFPGLRSFRWKIADGLRWMGLPVKPRPLFRRYTTSQLDKFLARAGLGKIESMTLGFGPFTFLGKRLFSESVGIKAHRYLQKLASRGVSGICSTGTEYIVVARKSAV